MTGPDIATKRGRRNRCGAFLGDSRGATAVEFALVAAPFLALIIALIQTFLVFFAQELLESVVSRSARLVMTGQVKDQAMTQAAFKQKVCDQVVIFFTCGATMNDGLMIDLQVANSWTTADTSMPPLTFDSTGTVSNTWQFNPGDIGDIVVLRVTYVWPVVFGPLGFNLSNLASGNRQIMASAAFQNEP